MRSVVYMRSDRTLEEVGGGFWQYNDQGRYYRLFFDYQDAIEFLETHDEELILHECEECDGYTYDKKSETLYLMQEDTKIPLKEDEDARDEFKIGLRKTIRYRTPMPWDNAITEIDLEMQPF